MILTSGQLLGVVIAAATVGYGTWRYVITPAMKMYRMVMSIGSNGSMTLFQTLHQIDQRVALSAAITDVIEMPMFQCSADWSNVRTNVAFRRLTGWAEADLMRGGFAERVGIECRADFEAAILRSRQFERDCYFHTAGGRVISVTLLAVPVFAGPVLVGWNGSLNRDLLNAALPDDAVVEFRRRQADA